MQYHAIPCNTMQYSAIQCITMRYNAIPCIIDNCWRSLPLPCGQYNGHFITSHRWKFPALLKVCLYCLSNLVLKILLLCASQIHDAVCGLIIQLHISTCTYKGPKSATLEETLSYCSETNFVFKHLMIYLSRASNYEWGLFPLKMPLWRTAKCLWL